MNVGIIGAGNIATKMANTINALEGICNYAIASRDLQKAEAFKETYGFNKTYGSYEEMLKDPNVDLVYIATIHSTHYPIMLECLKYKKPVLCEKCFTTSLQDTMDIYKKFEEQNLFICEALWTSFMPSRQLIHDLLFDKKVIGKIKSMALSYQIPISQVERIKRKDLGGGAMMDLGVYPVSFVYRTLGFDYESVNISNTKVNRYGTDMKAHVEFIYKDGVKALCKIDCISNHPKNVVIRGTQGKMVIHAVDCPQTISITTRKNGEEIINCAPPLGGFEYQILACKKALEEGRVECSEWTHQNSIDLSYIVDKAINVACAAK